MPESALRIRQKFHALSPLSERRLCDDCHTLRLLMPLCRNRI